MGAYVALSAKRQQEGKLTFPRQTSRRPARGSFRHSHGRYKRHELPRWTLQTQAAVFHSETCSAGARFSAQLLAAETLEPTGAIPQANLAVSKLVSCSPQPLSAFASGCGLYALRALCHLPFAEVSVGFCFVELIYGGGLGPMKFLFALIPLQFLFVFDSSCY